MSFENIEDKDFIMSPKVDFAFKMLFGDEKNKDILIAFLSSVLKLPRDNFKELKLVNTELLREFKEDKKGILDVRVKNNKGEEIDIEIQVLPTKFMPQRTLFYWAKMYNSQIKAGDTYDKLQKCITINILDFECIPINKLHTTFHISADETGDRLTDVLEIHFLEIDKLKRIDELKDAKDETLKWLRFLDAKSKEEMQMIAKQDRDIEKAYEMLEIMSKSKEKRMAYEARQAEIMDQRTREKIAKEQGIQQGLEQGIKRGEEKKAKEIAKALLGLLDDESISEKTGLTIEEIKSLYS